MKQDKLETKCEGKIIGNICFFTGTSCNEKDKRYCEEYIFVKRQREKAKFRYGRGVNMRSEYDK